MTAGYSLKLGIAGKFEGESVLGTELNEGLLAWLLPSVVFPPSWSHLFQLCHYAVCGVLVEVLRRACEDAWLGQT